jgi:hypothetical protein
MWVRLSPSVAWGGGLLPMSLAAPQLWWAAWGEVRLLSVLSAWCRMWVWLLIPPVRGGESSTVPQLRRNGMCLLLVLPTAWDGLPSLP